MLPKRHLVDDDDPIFEGGHRTPEPPPTPREMFHTISLSLAGILFMVLVIVFFASVLAR